MTPAISIATSINLGFLAADRQSAKNYPFITIDYKK
jgi:hypothetical protein